MNRALLTEVQSSVRNIESGMSQLHQAIGDKHRAIFRSQGAFEDQTNAEIEKFEKRVFLVERAVRSLPSSGAPAASGPDRAASSGTTENGRKAKETDMLSGLPGSSKSFRPSTGRLLIGCWKRGETGDPRTP